MKRKVDGTKIIKECEESIERLERYGSITMQSKSFFKDVIRLMERNMPKPPALIQDSDRIYYACPICRNPILTIMSLRQNLSSDKPHPGYCSACGQAVKWE